MLGAIVAIIAILIFSLAVRQNKKRFKCLSNLPGPPPNPLVGNLWDFKGPTTEFLNKLMEYTQEYGRILRLHDGPFRIAILITDAKFMEYILGSTKLIDKGWQYQFLHNWLNTGLLTSSGAKWKQRRRMLTPAFHFSILETFVDNFNSVGDIFINKLRSEVGKNSVDVYPLVSLCTLDIICEAAMGIKINAQDNDDSQYVRSVKTMCNVIINRTFSLVAATFYPVWSYFKERKALKILHNHTDHVINERMKPLERDNSLHTVEDDMGIKKKMAFLDLLLQSNMDGKYLSRVDIREEVDTFMFEGHDTTSSAITFSLYSLAMHPEVQKKAIEEQKSLFENLRAVQPTISDLGKMKYLEMVIKEVLRLYPSVPFYGRNIAEEFEYGGTVYPKGVTLMIFPFGAHRDPEYFPEPNKFIPERFETNELENPYVYVPFSAGPRNCIGQKFAMLEMKSTISKVLRHFELLPSTPAHQLKLAPEIILLSKNGVCISFRNRQ